MDGERRSKTAATGAFLLIAAALIAIGIYAIKEFAADQPGTADATRSTSDPRPARHQSKTPGGRAAPDAIAAALGAAHEYLGQKQYHEAETILRTALESDSTNQDLRLAMAQAQIGLGRFDEAYAQYQAVLAASSTGAPVDAELQFQAGTLASKAGMLDRAEEHYSAARAANPREDRYPLYLAMVQIRKGNRAAASASLLLALRLNPDLAEAWGVLAEIEIDDNQLSLAQQHIATARRIQPDLPRWKIAEARALKRDANPGQAATLLLTLDEKDRNDKAVLRLLGECYGLLQKPADAAHEYARAFDANPTDGDLALEASRWFARAGETELAGRYARIAETLGIAGANEAAPGLPGSADPGH